MNLPDPQLNAIFLTAGDDKEIFAYPKAEVERGSDAWQLVLQDCGEYDFRKNPFRKNHTLLHWVWIRNKEA